jgi:hypothetical protein
LHAVNEIGQRLVGGVFRQPLIQGHFTGAASR